MKILTVVCSVLVLGACSYFDAPEPVVAMEEAADTTSLSARMSAAQNVPGATMKPVTSEYADITKRTSKGSVEIFSLDGGFESDRATPSAYTTTNDYQSAPMTSSNLSVEETAERARREQKIGSIYK